MPRVLLLCEYPTLNGGEHSLLAVLPHLQTAGYQFEAVAPAAGPLAEALVTHGANVLPLAAHGDGGARRSQADMREQIAAAIAKSRPDLLHANSLSMGRLAGPVAAELGCPSVSHLRDIVGLSDQAVTDLNRNRRLLAVSRAAREYHIAQGLDAARTHVVYNGVDTAHFFPRQPSGWLHAELGLPADAQLIGAVGQLVLRKGHDVLTAAAQLLAARHPRAHFLIVGSRFSEKAEAYAHEAAVRQALTTGPLAGRGHFLGFRADVARMLPEFTLLAHPARQEPLGRVLLEAAAAGAPVVATDVGGTREIFLEGAAQIVPVNDPAALAGAIDLLLNDPVARARQRQLAAARVRDEFSAERSAARLAEHYSVVLAEPVR